MTSHDAIPKIFRATLLLFATTLGIGVYALIGAPIKRIDFGAHTNSLLHKTANAASAVLSAIPLPGALPSRGVGQLPLTKPELDLEHLKAYIRGSDWGDNATREVTFSLNNVPITADELLAHFADTDVSDQLRTLLNDYRYFATRDMQPRGTLFIATKGRDYVFAALLPQEKTLALATFGLVHPAMSESEVRMHAGLTFASRTIGDTDARVMESASGTPILIWGFKGDTLVIAGSTDDFVAAMKAQ